MKNNIRLFSALIFFALLAGQGNAQDAQKRRDTLMYGLENEIVELIQELQQKKDVSMLSDLEALFARTRSLAVRDSILSLYGVLENPAFRDYSLEVLEDPYEYRNATVQAVFAYVQKLNIREASPLVRGILDNESPEFRDVAIRTLGKIGSADDAAFLFEYLQGHLDGDERQRLILRQNIMAALGELKSEEVWEEFVSIAKDEEENTIIRATAARAIGSIGKTEGMQVLADIFETDDPILRAAVVAGLSGYTEKLAVDVTIEGLKDPHYRVRLEALDSLMKTKTADAAPFVRYRAANDPVEAVQMKAFEVLAILDETDSTQWMIEQVREEKTNDKIRMRIITVMMEHTTSAIIDDAIQVAYASLKDDKKTWLRYELGKLFAKHNDSRLSDVAEAYIVHRDTVTKGLGIELFNRNRFNNLKPYVETIAEDEKMGGLQRQAKRSLAAE